MRLVLAGFCIWAVGFLIVYALQATGCAGGWEHLRALLVAVALLCLGAAAGSVLWAWRSTGGFLHNVALLTNGAATLAVALNFGALLWLPVCA